MMTVRLTFLGAVGTVTGSKYLIQSNHSRVLVDCGLFQGPKPLRLRNWAEPAFNPRGLDAVLLTHAHLDHSGYLPLLVNEGFQQAVFCTEGTRDLCAVLLPDSGRIQEEDAAHANRRGYSKHHPALPLYREQDAWRSHTPVLVDDIISTARTMIETIEHLNRLGLDGVVCIGVHGIFAPHAYEDLSLAGASRIVTSYSVRHESNDIDLTPLLASAVRVRERLQDSSK